MKGGAMKLRGEMELPVATDKLKNIKDVHECPKCQREDLNMRYDPVFDHIKVECEVCGYTFECAPADKADKASELAIVPSCVPSS